MLTQATQLCDLSQGLIELFASLSALKLSILISLFVFSPGCKLASSREFQRLVYTSHPRQTAFKFLHAGLGICVSRVSGLVPFR